MNTETAAVVASVSHFIRDDDLAHLQSYWHEWGGLVRVDWPEVWKRAFLAACQREQLATAQWLYQRYQEAPLGFRLGLRSTVNYARAMARKAGGDSALLAWLVTLG